MSQSSSRENNVVVGAGIIGLDVALVLAERGFGDRITVVAEHLPGDTALAYTSPWAGCNFSVISGRDKNALRWDKLGYVHLSKLASQNPAQSFVRRTPSLEYWDDEVPHEKIKDMAEYLEGFKVVPKDELPEGTKFGVSFATLTLNAPSHLNYLYQRLQKQWGVRFIRQKITNIQNPFSNPRTQVVFNCVGNAAKTLAGVEDAKCYPTRGQVLLACAPRVRTNVMRHGRDYETCIIPRPESNGNVILGVYMQKGNDDSATYLHEAESIINRTKDMSPELAADAVEALAAFSGLRPSRDGGARVERSDVDVAGFQAGYGMATDVVAIVDDILQQWDREMLPSKL